MKDAKTVFVSCFASFKRPPNGLYGASAPQQWLTIAKLMRESGVSLPANFDPKTAYTDKFIAEINKFDRRAIEAQAKSRNE